MANKTLSITGRVFKATPSGEFIVPRRHLRGFDLTQMPANTALTIDYGKGRHGISVIVASLQGPGSNGTEVAVDYLECPHCWINALSYGKYMGAAQELLKQALPAGMHYAHSFDEEDGIHHVITTTRHELTIDDIEAVVTAEVDKALLPLTTFTTTLNASVWKQFGV